MKTLIRIVEYVMLMAILVLLSLMLTGHVRADTPAPADICTGDYFYKDACGDWRAGWPGDGDATTQGNCAHGFMAKDNTDGVWYYIVGGGSGGTRYPKPRASAPFAVSWWEKCFVAHDPSLVRTFPSCAMPPVGGTWTPRLVPLSSPLIPAPQRAAWSARWNCGIPHTPVFTNTRTPTVQRTASRTPTRTKTPTPGGCVGPGGVPCQTPIRTPSRTPTVAPPTVTMVNTSVPPTPAPARTVLPPSTSRPSPREVTPRSTAIPSSTPSASTTNSAPTTTATVALPAATSSPTPTSTEKPRNGCLGAAVVTLGAIMVLAGRALTRNL